MTPWVTGLETIDTVVETAPRENVITITLDNGRMTCPFCDRPIKAGHLQACPKRPMRLVKAQARMRRFMKEGRDGR